MSGLTHVSLFLNSLGVIMATADKVLLDINDEKLRKLWVREALDFRRRALLRSRDKEVPGAEVYELRTKEIRYLESLAEYFR